MRLEKGLGLDYEDYGRGFELEGKQSKNKSPGGKYFDLD